MDKKRTARIERAEMPECEERLKPEITRNLENAHISGDWRNCSQFRFMEHLIELGLAKYWEDIRYAKEIASVTWTGCFQGVMQTGNVIYPKWG